MSFVVNNVLCLAAKVANRMHVSTLFGKIVGPFYRGSDISGSKMSHDEMERFLHSVSPDNGMSCIRTQPRKIEAEYDLQIIIPAYQVEKYITECMESAINQKTRYKYLVTVIDDGSTDSTARLLAPYSDKECVEVIRQENRGLSGARNRGLDSLKARYVTFLDSDDVLPSGAVEALMNAAMRLDADIVEGSIITIDEAGNNIPTRIINVDADDVPSSALKGLACGRVYRSNIFERISFPEKYWFEDTLGRIILYDMAGRKATISDVVYKYRRNMSGITATSVGNPRVVDSYYVTRRLLNDRAELGLGVDRALYDAMLHQFALNQIRISTLRSIEVERVVFECQRNMLNSLFAGYKTSRAHKRPFEQALRGGNFKAYRVFAQL